MKIIIASNNAGKVKEYKQLLAPLGYNAVSQSEAGISLEVDETGATFEENARLKSRAIFKISGIPVIADDSGLEVDFLNGEPGVFSARYAPVGQRRSVVLKKLNNVPKERRTARFVCCICYMDEHGEKLVRGECEGFIGFENRGENGFGYDSIFMVESRGELHSPVARSFAELSDFEKNKISHRGKALQKLVKELQK